MEQNAGPQIGQRAFFQALIILSALMMVAGVLMLSAGLEGSYRKPVP